MVSCRARPPRPLRGSAPLLLLAMAVAACALLPAAHAQDSGHHGSGKLGCKGIRMDGRILKHPTTAPPCYTSSCCRACHAVYRTSLPACPALAYLSAWQPCRRVLRPPIHPSRPGASRASDVIKPKPDDVVKSVGETRGPGDSHRAKQVVPCCLDGCAMYSED